MMLLDFGVVLLSLGATAQTPQQPGPTADSASEILARLSEIARGQSCTVVYRLTNKTEDAPMRFVYLAPDRLKLEVQRELGTTTCWVSANRWVLHADLKQDGFLFNMDPSRSSETLEFDAAFNEIFPRSELASSHASSGCSLSFQLHPDKPYAGDKYIKFELSWQPYREHPFAWLTPAGDWSAARVEQEMLVVEYPNGARGSLSRSSGWPQELMHPSGSHLSLVEFSTQVDEDEFVIPAPRDGLRDATKEWIQSAPHQFFLIARNRLYETAARVAQAGGREREVLQQQVTRLFELLYESELKRSFKPWFEKVAASIDHLTQYRDQRLKEIGDDPELRAEHDRGLAKWLAEFDTLLANTIDGYAKKIPVVDAASLYKDLALELHSAEQAGARAAFQNTIAAPLKAELATSLQ